MPNNFLKYIRVELNKRQTPISKFSFGECQQNLKTIQNTVNTT